MRFEPCDEVKIDLKDKKIIELLVKDGRMAFTEIAKKVMLSKDAVAYRIKRLQEKGVIKKFTLIADFKKFGYPLYNVFLQTREVTSEKEETFLKYLDKEPRIVDVIDYSDVFDFQLKIVAKSIEDFDRIIEWVKTEYADIIEHITVMPVVDCIENLMLPKEISEAHEIRAKNKEIELDEKDIKIIKLLNENCRLSSYDIAEKVGINADTVIYRIKNLINSGAIRFTTVINLSALGYEGYSLMLRLKAMGGEKRVEEFIKENKNVLIADKCVGEWDLILNIVTKDAREFHTIIKKMRKEFGDIIMELNTLMAYREYEFDYASFVGLK